MVYYVASVGLDAPAQLLEKINHNVRCYALTLTRVGAAVLGHKIDRCCMVHSPHPVSLLPLLTASLPHHCAFSC